MSVSNRFRSENWVDPVTLKASYQQHGKAVVFAGSSLRRPGTLNSVRDAALGFLPHSMSRSSLSVCI